MFVAYRRDQIFKDVGTTRQLFVDDDVIAVVKNVTRTPHSPKKHPSNPLISRDQPWEVIPLFRMGCMNVLHDPADQLFQVLLRGLLRLVQARPTIPVYRQSRVLRPVA